MSADNLSASSSPYRGKRLLDLAIAAPLLVALAPLMALIAAVVYAGDANPPFFRQRRRGADGAEFILTKFRSMPVGTPSVESARAGELATTKVGDLLRRLSLDELPQLLSVVSGSMSLVGPRPALPAQLELIELRRVGGADALKPGLTGWAQVNSYDGMLTGEKAELDNEYARRVSFVFDLNVLVRTVRYLAQKPPQY